VAKHRRLLILCLVGILIPARSLLGQSTNAAITGQVTDPLKAVIVQAKVTAINNNTNVRYEGTTNQTGSYLIPSVPPGDYRIEVEKTGFKTIVKPDVILHVQDTIELNFEMVLGSASETVTVTGGTPMINTTDGSVSTVVDQTYVKNMPLNGRSFQDLILLTPGVVTQSPQNSGNSFLGGTGEFSVNGERQESNTYIVDGVSANVGAASGAGMVLGAASSGSVPAATALGTTQALVSVDALQEFRVQSSTYSAEYGRNPGGQFSFETKSGTNQWHGTAYDYFRNGALDAADWFNDYFQLPQPAIRQNDFGSTLGGPVRIPSLYNGRDRTFFFVSYEGLRLAAPQPATVSPVPDTALRANAPAVLQPVLNAYPQPSPNGIDDLTTGLAQFIGSASNPSSLDSTSVRLDHVVSQRIRLFFRFSDTASSSATQGLGSFSPALVTTLGYAMRTYTGGLSTVFTNNLSNELRLNYTSNAAVSNVTISTLGGNTPVDLRQLLGLGHDSQPLFFLLLGGKAIILQQARATGTQRQWNLVDAVNLSLGRHQLKLGVDYRRLTPFDTPSVPQVQFLYFSKSAVQNNTPLARTTVFAPAYPLYTNFSAFAQDNWRVSQRLNVSIGLRWEVNPPPGVTQGLMPYTVQGTNFSNYALAPQGTPLWKTTWFNFAPRLGIAYVLRNNPGRELVVRGGAGVFFDTGQQEASGGFLNGPGFNASSGFKPGSFPSYPAIPTIVNPPTNSTSVYGFYPHLQLPYTLQWNASIEQALGKSQALTLSYVGSHAARLLQINQLSISNNPKLSSFIFVENGLTSDYGALQSQFRRRFSRGFTMLGSYTWSHCIDYGSQDYNFSAQRGNCAFDVRNNLSAAFSYDLPNIGRNGFANAVLHHWGLDDRISARSGFPVTLGGDQLLQPDGRFFFAGLDVVPNQPIYLYGSNCTSVLQGLNRLKAGQGCPGGRAINPNAFVQVPVDPNTGNATRRGTAPRNFVRGFGAWQMNLGVRREFPIYENLGLQFRVEAFNIFNHPHFGLIDPSLSSLTFGQATATLAGSLGSSGLNSLYQAGGSRSLQFALKLVF